MQFDMLIFGIVMLAGTLAIALWYAAQVLWWVFLALHLTVWQTWTISNSWWSWLLTYKNNEFSRTKKFFLFFQHVLYNVPEVVTTVEFRRYRENRVVFWRSPFDYTI